MKFCIAALSVLLSLHLQAQTAAPDAQAKFLAGLPVEGTPLEPLTKDGSWARHAKEFGSAWQTLEGKQLAKIRGWTPDNLTGADHETAPLFYFFSGPDILYANTFFPSASTYVLCGLEPVGTPPDVMQLAPGALDHSLANLRKSLNAVLSFSFFKTKEMKDDLRATQLTGTLPVLYVFLSRMGNHIDNVTLVNVNDDGDISEGGKTPGVKIEFTLAGGAPQSLYYFSTDLSNEGIKHHGGFINFCSKLGKGNGFAKAASYLMHEAYFSAARDFLLANTRVLVQDDSGIPVRHFAPDRWWVKPYGHYVGPIKLFEKSYQKDLTELFKAGKSSPLPFSFGYQWHANESSLVVAEALKAVPKAIPVKD